jgi:hypothetical protein
MRLDSPNHRESEFDRLRITPTPAVAVELRTFIGVAVVLAGVLLCLVLF